MEFSKPIQKLLDEHDVIYSVLEATEAVARRSSDEFEQGFYEKAFDFFHACLSFTAREPRRCNRGASRFDRSARCRRRPATR